MDMAAIQLARCSSGVSAVSFQRRAGGVVAAAAAMPRGVPSRHISRSSIQSHVVLTAQPAARSALPGLAARQWPGAKVLGNPSMQVIARRYQRTPLQVWQRYQVQCGLPGANTGSDEHRSSINSFALSLEEMQEVTQATKP